MGWQAEAEVMDSGCSRECMKPQINAYHRQKSVGVRDNSRVCTKKGWCIGQLMFKEKYLVCCSYLWDFGVCNG